MRFKSVILCSASAAVLALSSPAAAQAQPDLATPPDPTVEAQETPAPTEEEGSPQTDDPVQSATGEDSPEPSDTIVVTGLRRSLESAKNIKRNSEQIVDAIVAEDIGKLPDITASAALARVPGVQVNRAAGEAAQVQVRGLPDLSTTYNGREIFTSFGRFVAIQDFPVGSVAALEVYKSSTANLIKAASAGRSMSGGAGRSISAVAKCRGPCTQCVSSRPAYGSGTAISLPVTDGISAMAGSSGSC